MKHKLKLSFWALGILVLIMSQLFVLAPAAKVSAQSLTIDSTKEQTHAFAIYSAWHACLSTVDTTAKVSSDLIMDKSSAWTQSTHILGFAGSDGNDNDGQATCAEIGRLWMGIAGTPDVGAMLTDLGFQKNSQQSCQSTGMSGQSCYDTWSLGSGGQKGTLSKLTSVAKAKSIPTSLPTWGRYILSATALEVKCQPTSSITTSGTRTSPTASVNVVSDNMGTLTSKTYSITTDESVPAYPNMNGGNKASCQYLVDDVKASATKFSTALVDDRINSTISIANTAICDKLEMTNDRERLNCLENFRSYFKTCIDDYYAGNLTSGTRSRTEPFDTDYVATCVETKAKKAGYDITASDIADILGDSQNQATPEVDPSSDSAVDICDILGDEVPMKWMACAVLTAMNGIANALYDMIQNLLYTPISQILASPQYDKTISNFRIFGMAFIFIIGLIMVVAQATGSEFVDAYTVRKVLPKLGIAIIGIAIAVPVLKVLITFTNDLGIMAGNFITDITPTEAIKPPDAVKSDAFAGLVGGGIISVIGIITAIVAVVAQGPAALTYIVVAVVALLIAFVTLAIRQLIIVVLILFAPIAIAASALPGTEKLWKFWRTTLITTLMMFPIIMIFLKSGVFMASIFGNIGDELDNQLYFLIAAIIFIAPYFMLPLAFKMAGGLVGNIFGMVNDRSKGLFDRMRNMRSNATKKNWERLKEGTRFNPESTMGNKLNTFSSDMAKRAEVFSKYGASSLDSSKFQSRFEAISGEAATKKAIDIVRSGGLSQDDAVLIAAQKAIRTGGGRKAMRAHLESAEGGSLRGAELEQAVGEAEHMLTRGTAKDVDMALSLQRFAVGTGFNNPDTGEFDFNAAMEAIHKSSGGNRSIARNLIGASKGIAMNAGQVAWGGASFGTLATQYDNFAQAGYEKGAFDGSAIALNSFESTTLGQTLSGRDVHVRAEVRAVTDRIQQIQGGTAQPRGDETLDQELSRLTAQLDNLVASAPLYGAPGRQKEVVEGSRATEQAKEYISRAVDDGVALSTPTVPTVSAVENQQQRQQRYGEYRGQGYNDPRYIAQQQQEQMQQQIQQQQQQNDGSQ